MELTRQALAGLAKASTRFRHAPGVTSWLNPSHVTEAMHPHIPAYLLGTVDGGDETWCVCRFEVTLVDGTVTEALLLVERSKLAEVA